MDTVKLFKINEIKDGIIYFKKVDEWNFCALWSGSSYFLYF